MTAQKSGGLTTREPSVSRQCVFAGHTNLFFLAKLVKFKLSHVFFHFTAEFCDTIFCLKGSKLFNDIPNEMKDLNSVMIFKTRILEFYRSQAF